MKTLYEYIGENLSSFFKLSKEDKVKLLNLDKEYGDLVMMYRQDLNVKDMKNLDEECSKFLKLRERGLKYYPKIELVTDNGFLTDGILPRLKNLLVQFRNFNCYISKYYIELIDEMIRTVEFYCDVEHKHYWYTEYKKQTPSLENLEKAMQMLKEHPYKEIDGEDRNIDGKTAAKIIQKYIDKKGYKWEVKLNDKMIPRMNVDVNKTMNVNLNAKFSEADIEGLKSHEVDGHIGRRFYGYKTGLYLFVAGLLWRNTLDEGLAIYNSLHKCSKIKPNVQFNIALKTIIAYYLDKKDFCELFDMCKELAPNMPDKALFSTIIRYKRELQDCSIIGGNGDDQSYFCGYQIVKNMTDKERDDVLKYNIGPDQLQELPNIKKFLKLNKFPSLI